MQLVYIVVENIIYEFSDADDNIEEDNALAPKVAWDSSVDVSIDIFVID